MAVVVTESAMLQQVKEEVLATSPLALEIVDDLVGRGLPHVYEGGAREVLGHNLTHCRTPVRRRLPERRPDLSPLPSTVPATMLSPSGARS